MTVPTELLQSCLDLDFRQLRKIMGKRQRLRVWIRLNRLAARTLRFQCKCQRHPFSDLLGPRHRRHIPQASCANVFHFWIRLDQQHHRMIQTERQCPRPPLPDPIGSVNLKKLVDREPVPTSSISGSAWTFPNLKRARPRGCANDFHFRICLAHATQENRAVMFWCPRLRFPDLLGTRRAELSGGVEDVPTS